MSDVSTVLGQDRPKPLFILLDDGAVFTRIAIVGHDREDVVPVESVVVDCVPEPGAEDLVPETADQDTGSEIRGTNKRSQDTQDFWKRQCYFCRVQFGGLSTWFSE